MCKNKKIAFLDSGVGGLTVLAQAIQHLPHEQYVYYADRENLPYGTKSKKEIRKFVSYSVEFLSQFNLKALVVACNTATSVTIKDLRNSFDFPIIGMEPAIKPALEIDQHKNVILTATKKTLKEKKLKKLIKKLEAKPRIIKVNLQELVTFAERREFEGEEVKNYLLEKFDQYDWDQISSIVLGCTHFIYFKNILNEIIPSSIKIVDGNTGTINRLKSQIDVNQKGELSIKYYESGIEVSSTELDSFLKYSLSNL